MTRQLPPLNALRAFETAARHMSFTQAADELHVTPAAISHQVKALEEYLGIQLFRRLTRGIRLTDAGQAALPGLRESFDGLAAAVMQLRGAEESGVLNVSSLHSFAAKWLIHRIDQFSSDHPDIDARISASTGLVDFARDDVDLAIRYGLGDYPGLRVELLMKEELFPVCSPKLLEGTNPLKAPDDLRHHSLLHDDSFNQFYHEQFEKTFHGSFPDWSTWLSAAGVHEIDSSHGTAMSPSYTVIQAAIEGQGVALGRSVLVGDDLATGVLVKPFELSLPLDFAYYLVYPETAADRPKIAAFRAWIMEEAGRQQAPTVSAAQ